MNGKHEFVQTLHALSDVVLIEMQQSLAKQQRDSSRRLAAVRKELKRRKQEKFNVR